MPPLAATLPGIEVPLTGTAGAIATAVCQTAHAALARCGQWITSEKPPLERAGLRDTDSILAGLTPELGHLAQAVDTADAMLRARPGWLAGPRELG